MNLFADVVPINRRHPFFNRIFSPDNAPCLDVLIDWARGFEDRDSKFVKEFQLTFSSSFWELYIFAALKNLQFEMSFNFPSPDFLTLKPFELAIEATVAMHDEHTLPASQASFQNIPDNLPEFTKEVTVRLCNSITSKAKKFKESYHKQIQFQSRPFILAIAAVDRPHFHLACHRAIEAALFGYFVDEQAYLDKGDFSKPLRGEQLEYIEKHNGVKVELGLFNDGKHPEISAVLFSSVATWGKVIALANDPEKSSVFAALRSNSGNVMPKKIVATKSEYREHLLDGLRVYHNPGATIPVSPEVFRNEHIYQTYFDSKNGDWQYENAYDQLLFRQVNTVKSTAEK